MHTSRHLIHRKSFVPQKSCTSRYFSFPILIKFTVSSLDHVVRSCLGIENKSVGVLKPGMVFTIEPMINMVGPNHRPISSPHPLFPSWFPFFSSAPLSLNMWFRHLCRMPPDLIGFFSLVFLFLSFGSSPSKNCMKIHRAHGETRPGLTTGRHGSFCLLFVLCRSPDSFSSLFSFSCDVRETSLKWR